MKNITITILTVLVLGLGCTLGFVLLNKDDNAKNSIDNKQETVEKEEKVAEQKKEDNEESSTEKENSYAKLYRSNDNKYVLLLAEYEHSGLNPKAQNTVAKDFYLKIDQNQATEYLVGNYSIKGNVLTLSESGHHFETIYDENLSKVWRENAGSNEFLFEYNDAQIRFNNIVLYLVK